MQERKEKAKKLAAELKKTKARLADLDVARDYLLSVFVPGSAVHHKTFGDGTITEVKGTNCITQYHPYVFKFQRDKQTTGRNAGSA